MKKFFDKKTIFVIILCGIVFSSITAYAYSITSSDISFSSTKPGFTATNVGSALDTLYDRSNTIYDKIDGTHTRNYYMGNYNSDAEAVLTLNKGHYYIIANFVKSQFASSASNELSNYDWGDYIQFTNVTCMEVSSKYHAITPSNKNSGSYARIGFIESIYKCDSNAGARVRINIHDAYAQNDAAFITGLDAIKID